MSEKTDKGSSAGTVPAPAIRDQKAGLPVAVARRVARQARDASIRMRLHPSLVLPEGETNSVGGSVSTAGQHVKANGCKAWDRFRRITDGMTIAEYRDTIGEGYTQVDIPFDTNPKRCFYTLECDEGDSSAEAGIAYWASLKSK